MKIEGFLPKPGSDDQLTTRSTDDHTWIAVNGRPVIMKDISKVTSYHWLSVVTNAPVLVLSKMVKGYGCNWDLGQG